MKPTILALIALLPAASAAQEPWSTDIQVELRARYEDRNNRDFNSSFDDSRADSLGRARLNITSRNRETGMLLFFQPQLTGDHAKLPGPNDSYSRTSIHQAYIETPLPAAGLKARAGRQEFLLGSRRLVGNGDWSNIGRSFDGVRLDYAGGPLAVSAFATRLGDSANRVQSPQLNGVYATWKPRAGRQWDLYTLNKRDTVAGRLVNVVAFGGRGDAAFPGGWNATAEVVGETGRVSGKDLSAWAYSAGIAKSFKAPMSPRIALEYNAASGGDPADPDKVRTFDQLFPTNHAYYGTADLQGWRNMNHVQVALRANVTQSVTLDAQHHWFRLQDARDFWYSDNGQPNRGAGAVALRSPSGTAGKNVGREWDVFATMPATADLNLQIGYARFLPGGFVKATNGKGDPSSWWYAQAAYRR